MMKILCDYEDISGFWLGKCCSLEARKSSNGFVCLILLRKFQRNIFFLNGPKCSGCFSFLQFQCYCSRWLMWGSLGKMSNNSIVLVQFIKTNYVSKLIINMRGDSKCLSSFSLTALDQCCQTNSASLNVINEFIKMYPFLIKKQLITVPSRMISPSCVTIPQ